MEEATQDSMVDLRWEQCARMLLTLSSTDICEMQSLIAKIVENIIANPEDLKYSRIKFSSKALQSKVLSKNGGHELLRAIGFATDVSPVDAEKYLVFPVMQLMATSIATNKPEYLDILDAGLLWLENTVQTTLRFLEQKATSTTASSGSTALRNIPAQTIIQLKLPAGKVVLGGFLLGDRLSDVRRFASSFFAADRHEGVQLRLPHELKRDLRIDDDKTLSELNLYPQVKLVVTTVDPTTIAPVMMQAAHDDGVEQARLQRKRLLDQKTKKVEERKAEEQWKMSILSAYKEDRESRVKPSTTIEEAVAVEETSKVVNNEGSE